MTIVLRGGESGSIGGGQQPLSNSSTQRAANRSSGVGSRFNGNRYRRTANSTIAGTGSSSSSIGKKREEKREYLKNKNNFKVAIH